MENATIKTIRDHNLPPRTCRWRVGEEIFNTFDDTVVRKFYVIGPSGKEVGGFDTEEDAVAYIQERVSLFL